MPFTKNNFFQFTISRTKLQNIFVPEYKSDTMEAKIEFSPFEHKSVAPKLTMAVSKQLKTDLGDVNLNRKFRIEPVSRPRLRKMT